MPHSALWLLKTICRGILLVILFALAMAPAVLLTFLVKQYSVNVPSWDEWSVAELFRLWHTHSLSFDYLISQHNESRKFFPRLVILAIGLPTRWNVRYDMVFIIFLALVSSFNILLLGWKTVGGSAIRLLWLWFLANLLIFTLAGQENWLWGLQMVCYFPIASITTALVLFQFGMPLALKTALGLCLAIISTFSYANGIIAFFLLPVALLAAPGTEKSSRRSIIYCGVAWLAVLAGSWVLYFHDYHHPPSSPAMASPFKQPGQLFVYFLAFLGSPFKCGIEQANLTLAAWIAGVVLVIFCIFLVRLLFKQADHQLLRRSVPWLLLAVYTLCSGAITTLGRFGFGMLSALASRYCAFSVFLPVALIFLIPLIEDASAKSKPLSQALKASAYTLLTIGFLIVCTLTNIAGAQDMHTRWLVRLQAKAALEWSNVSPDPVGLAILNPDSELIHRYARLLDSWGYLRPPLFHTADIRPIAIVMDHLVGAFDVMSPTRDGKLFCGGWGWLEPRQMQADAVLITADPPAGYRPVIAVTTLHFDREDANKFLKAPGAGKLGWGCNIDPATIPSGCKTLSAWAYDAENCHAYYLGTMALPKPTTHGS